jgi:carbamoyltransferase
MYILGINGGLRAGYRDTSAVLLHEGRVVAAVEEERLNRIKHAPGQLPDRAITEVLDLAGIRMQDVGIVATHGSTWGEAWPAAVREYLRFRWGHAPELAIYAHHNCHAASSYYASGYAECLILTTDGSGDGVSTALWRGRGQAIKLLRKWSRPQSLGLFYSLITQLCGFTRDSDEYKLMGLAPYGDPEAVDLSWLLATEPGNYQLDPRALPELPAGAAQPTVQQPVFTPWLVDKLGPARLKGAPITDRERNLAAAAQHRLTQALFNLVQPVLQETGLRHLCLAGGVALNCAANGVLYQQLPLQGLYVPPVASDAGISLGAAYLAAQEAGFIPQPLTTAQTGRAWGAAEIREVLEACNLESMAREVSQPALVAAQHILAGKTVGWFQGAAELGPRALGARSLLARANDPHMKERINAQVKFRESFRPFCPSLRSEDAAALFNGLRQSFPYMTVALPGQPSAVNRWMGAYHVDGTARLQTVAVGENALFHELLTHVAQAEGQGVVLNTSLNRAGEPMVYHPREALSTFFGSGMEVLVLGNFVLEK